MEEGGKFDPTTTMDDKTTGEASGGTDDNPEIGSFQMYLTILLSQRETFVGLEDRERKFKMERLFATRESAGFRAI